MPELTATLRTKRDRISYDQWVKMGAIETTPGDYVDQSFVQHQLEDDLQRYDVELMGYDPWNAVKLYTDMVKGGVDEERFLKMRQGIPTLGSRQSSSNGLSCPDSSITAAIPSCDGWRVTLRSSLTTTSTTRRRKEVGREDRRHHCERHGCRPFDGRDGRRNALPGVAMNLRDRIAGLIAGRDVSSPPLDKSFEPAFSASNQTYVPAPMITPSTEMWSAFSEVAGKLPAPTERTALTVSAIYACVNIIAGAISALPVNIYRMNLKNGERDQIYDDDLHWILNEEMTTRWASASGWEFLVQSLLLHGDAFAVINRKPGGTPPA